MFSDKDNIIFTRMFWLCETLVMPCSHDVDIGRTGMGQLLPNSVNLAKKFSSKYSVSGAIGQAGIFGTRI